MLDAKSVALLTTPGNSRARLSEFAYSTLAPSNPLVLLQEALQSSKEYQPIKRRIRQARKEGLIASDYLPQQIDEAEKGQVINKTEARSMRAYHDKVSALLAVDDFAPEDLARTSPAKKTAPRTKAVTRKTSKKKSATKKTSTKKSVKKKT